jgi:iron complex transport system substrate-binding protein
VRKFCLVLLLALVSGCSVSPGATESGERRIVVAAAGAMEMLNQLELSTFVVAVDERNSSVNLDLPKISDGHSLNLELILSLEPTDLVIDTLVGPKSALENLKSKGIRIIEIPLAESLDDVTRKYLELGDAFGVQNQAEQAASKFQDQLEAFKITNRDLRIAFLYLRGTNAIYLVGGKGSGADSLIQAVGSTDVGAQFLEDPFTPLSAEVMARLNPDVLLVMNSGLKSVGGITGLSQLPGLATTSAIKKSRIISIEDSELLNFGPSSIKVLELMSKELSRFDD